jgi:hypothetical protein
MIKKLIALYKIQFLVSVTLAIVLIAIKTVKDPLSIAFIIIAILIGTFILDLDYLIYAFFLEPEADFSKTLSAFVKHKDFINAFQFIEYHKNEMGERTLHSIIFQLVLVGAAIFSISAASNIYVKALILSIYVNSIYRLMELYFSDTYEQWFWALKNKPTRSKVMLYIFGLVGVLIYCLATL